MSEKIYWISNPAHFNGTTPHTTQLQQEIKDSSISSAVLHHITVSGDTVSIMFDSVLDGADETTLDGLIAAHVPVYTPARLHSISVFPETRRTKNKSWTLIGQFLFPGEKRLGTVNYIDVLAVKDASIDSYSVKIVNFATTDLVASDTFYNDSISSQTFSSLTNIPEDEAVLDIIAKADGPSNVKKNVLIQEIIIWYS